MARILVIDDEEDLRHIVRLCLTNSGHEVIDCADGHTGLQLAEEQAPDLVVTNVSMPGLTGLDVIERLRAGERTRTALILVLTGRRREELDARIALADAYLQKPFEPAQLIQLVAELTVQRTTSRPA